MLVVSELSGMVLVWQLVESEIQEGFFCYKSMDSPFSVLHGAILDVILLIGILWVVVILEWEGFLANDLTFSIDDVLLLEVIEELDHVIVLSHGLIVDLDLVSSITKDDLLTGVLLLHDAEVVLDLSQFFLDLCWAWVTHHHTKSRASTYIK